MNDYFAAEQFAVENANSFRQPNGGHTLKSRQLFLMIDLARTLRANAPDVNSLKARLSGAVSDYEEQYRRADNAEGYSHCFDSDDREIVSLEDNPYGDAS